jgi:hypothetical protein
MALQVRSSNGDEPQTAQLDLMWDKTRIREVAEKAGNVNVFADCDPFLAVARKSSYASPLNDLHVTVG